MEKTLPAIILKVTSDSPQGASLFRLHALFLSRVFEQQGIDLFVEDIAGGALFLYRSFEDFFKFHESAGRIPAMVSPPVGQTRISKKKTLTLTVEVIRHPPHPALDVIFDVIGRAHERVTPGTHFTRISSNTIKIQYESVVVFSETFSNVWNTLGKK